MAALVGTLLATAHLVGGGALALALSVGRQMASLAAFVALRMSWFGYLAGRRRLTEAAG